MAHSTYSLIKKNNGEHFARALRDANVLDMPDIIEFVEYAGRDADDNLIHYLKTLKQEIQEVQQNAIKKYFTPGEELCTFRDYLRYKQNYILNAVRMDANMVQRSDKPDRQDGTAHRSYRFRLQSKVALFLSKTGIIIRPHIPTAPLIITPIISSRD